MAIESSRGVLSIVLRSDACSVEKLGEYAGKVWEEGSYMEYIYKTQGTCSTEIKLNIEGDVITNVSFVGGCHGNLQAIPCLVEGLTVEEIEKKIAGIHCGYKQTSCADQLAKACRAAYEQQKAMQ